MPLIRRLDFTVRKYRTDIVLPAIITVSLLCMLSVHGWYLYQNRLLDQQQLAFYQQAYDNQEVLLNDMPPNVREKIVISHGNPCNY